MSNFMTIAAVLVFVCVASTQASQGDVNCDGTVNGMDVASLVLAITDPVGYQAAFPDCPLGNADCDCDGSADANDILDFVQCLLGSDCTPCSSSEMVFIPGGEFEMGDCFGEGESGELPVHTVYLSPYSIETYEVTNQQYADALNWACAQGELIEVAGGVVCKYNSGTSYSYCDTTTSSSYSRITWNGSTFGVIADKEDHPMVKVSWYGSVAFCNWRSEMEGKPLCYDLSTWTCSYGVAGYRLPTEAEWEKAARGGTPGHRFPWSDQDTIQHTRCNCYSYWSGGSPYFPYDTSPAEGCHPCWGVSPTPYTSPVGFFDGSTRYKADWNWPGSPTSYQTANGANGYGLYDMASNVWEWCNDKYSSEYYLSSPSSNPTGPDWGGSPVVRGGSWYSGVNRCRVAYRSCGPFDDRYSHVGFRCVLGIP